MVYVWIIYLTNSKRKKQEYIKRLINLQEKNWKEVSFDLHDNIGQNLLVINNDILKMAKNKDTVDLQKSELEKISSMVTESIEEIRRVSSGIFPHQIRKIGLRKAIESMINRVLGEYEIDVKIDICEIDRILNTEAELNLFRVIQEAVNNIIKHSKAENVTITISRTGTNLVTEINDDGKGFDYNKIVKTNLTGFGMFNMSERAKLIGGKLTVDSKPGMGTKIKIVLPLNLYNRK